MKKLILTLCFAILVIFGLGYLWKSHSLPPAQTSSGQLQITTSFYPMYFFASAIGGAKVSVTNITPAGTEPHDYEPTSGDIVHIQNSQLLILNGGVEPWAAKEQANLAGKPTQILIAGTGLLSQTVTDEEGRTGIDPHIWLSPPLAKKEVQSILGKIVSLDPQNKGYYSANAQALLLKLTDLDKEYQQGLSNCQSRDIITSHAAFGYLASAYHLNQISIAGLSPDAEPSLQELAQLSDFAKANHVRYIFFESLASPKLSQTLAQEIGGQTLVLNPLEGLTSDDLKQGKNYLTIMEDNLQNLETALACR